MELMYGGMCWMIEARRGLNAAQDGKLQERCVCSGQSGRQKPIIGWIFSGCFSTTSHVLSGCNYLNVIEWERIGVVDRFDA